jgi:DUF4097 and DUF4098 domain-containing protein YvlB
MQARHFLMVLLIALVATGCGAVNRNIQIADGEQVEGDVRNVNGAIRIGSDCRISGDVRNVNGSVVIGDDTTLGRLRTTNGAIEIGARVAAAAVHSTNGRIRIATGARIDEEVRTTNGAVELGSDIRVGGNVETANGRVRIAAGTEVGGTVAATNGPIELTGARVAAINGANGSIEILDGSVVEGDIHMRRTRGTVSSEPPRIVIGRDSVVEGEILIEREATLYIHETARTGTISGADPVPFSGDRP